MQAESRILAVLTTVHAAVGMAVASAVPGPLLAIDDLAFLAMGRTLAGGGAAALGDQAPYGVAYPSLLAPGWLIGLDESQMIVWSRGLNAILGAALVPVLYLLVRRVARVSFGRAATAAVIGASLPAAILTASIVWTERLLPLLVAAAAVLVLKLYDDPSRRTSAATLAMGVGMYATHPRMGPAALVVVAAVAHQYWRQGQRVDATKAVILGGLGIVAAELLRRALASAAFGATGRYDAIDLASRRGPLDVPDMAVRAGGAAAYLVLATAGLAALGMVMLWRSRDLRGWYVAMLGAVVVVAGWFLVGVDRADSYLHGRYIEVMAPPLVALGVIGLWDLPVRLAARMVVVSAVVGGFYGAWAGPGDIWAQGRSPVMMLGTEIGGAPFGGDTFEPGAAAFVAIVVGLAMIAAAHFRQWAVPVVAFAAIGMGVASGTETLDQLQVASVVGQTQAALADVEIDQIVVDLERVPLNLGGAVAWEVGLDRVSAEIGAGTTHLLLPADAAAPPNAELVAELPGGAVWALRVA